jgi:hypothetical protein
MIGFDVQPVLPCFKSQNKFFVNHTTMKKTITTILLVISSLLLKAQALDCGNMCVTNIVMNAEGGLLDISIINGSSQINYPIVTVIVDGDTVGNINQEFFLFAHIPAQMVTHTVPTSLSSVPANFTCVVTIEDSTTGQSCTLNYPCGANGVFSSPEKQVAVYPNPVKGILNVQSNSTIQMAEILDQSGRLVQSFGLLSSNAINVETLPSGIYFLKVNFSGSTPVSIPFTKE